VSERNEAGPLETYSAEADNLLPLSRSNINNHAVQFSSVTVCLSPCASRVFQPRAFIVILSASSIGRKEGAKSREVKISWMVSIPWSVVILWVAVSGDVGLFPIHFVDTSPASL